MISAGQKPNSVNREQQTKTTDLVCGGTYKLPNTDCASKVNGAIDTGFNSPQPMTAEQSAIYDLYLRVGRNWLSNQCLIDTKQNPAINFDAQKYVNCTAPYGSSDTAVKFGAGQKDMKFVTEFIPWAAQRARLNIGVTADDIQPPLPQNLVDAINEVKPVDGGFFAREGVRLFREAMNRIRPPSHEMIEKFAAADPAGAQVAQVIRDAAKNYKAAADDAGRQAVESAMVAKSARGVGQKPGYVIEWSDAPITLFTPGTLGLPPNTAIPQGLQRSLVRLYNEALPKFLDQGGTDLNALGTAVANAVKDDAKAKGIDLKNPDAMNDRIGRLGIDSVDGKGNTQTVKVKELTPATQPGSDLGVSAPLELISRLQAQSDPAKIYALNFLWRQILGTQNGKMGADLEGKIVENLAPASGSGGLYGKTAVQIVRQHVSGVDKTTGAVTMQPAPAEIFVASDKALDEHGKATGHQVGDIARVGASERVMTIYFAALNAAPKAKIDPATVPGRVSTVVQAVLFPDGMKRPSNSGATNLAFFMGLKFDKFNSDGSIQLTTIDGRNVSAGPMADIGPGVTGGIDTEAVMLVIPNDVAPPGAKDQEGANHVGGSAYAGLWVNWKPAESPFSLRGDAAVLWFSRPQLWSVPGQNAGVGPAETGDVRIGRVQNLSVTPRLDFPVGSAKLTLSAPLGYIGGRLVDPSSNREGTNGLGINEGIYPAGWLSTGPSLICGGRPGAKISGGETWNVGVTAPIGSAYCMLSPDTTGAHGFSGGVDITGQADVAKLGGAKNWGLILRTGFGYRGSSGDLPATKDGSKHAAPNELDYSTLVTGLGALALFNASERWQLGVPLGYRYQRLNQNDGINPPATNIHTVDFGVRGTYSFDNGQKLTLGLEALYYHPSGDKRVANSNTSASTTGNPNEECIPGVDCQPGSTSNVNVEGGDPQMSYAARDIYMRGASIWNLGPYVAWRIVDNDAGRFQLTAAWIFMPHKDLMSTESKVSHAGLLGFSWSR